MSGTQLAWLVGLAGIAAAIFADSTLDIVRKSAATRLVWFAIMLGGMMAGWTIGVHDANVLAALVCFAAVAGLFVTADGPEDAHDPNTRGVVAVIAAAVIVFGAMVYYDAIPACSWWHGKYMAYQQTPADARVGLAEWDWDLCASAFEIGNRAGGTR